jgi:L-erythrulose 1-phosphate isomerase
MRPKWIGTGWKMNFLLAEAEAYIAKLRDYFRSTPENTVTVFLVPPFTVLRKVCELAEGLPVLVGAQNMHWQYSGAYTGEISPAMVKDCGADLVELGHSERRSMFGETDFTVNKKVHAALTYGLKPLICVGESAPEKEFGASLESVLRQVKIALHGVSMEHMGEVIIAYEPVWAIGEGSTPAEPGYANFIHAAIRKSLAEMCGQATAERVPVLYGGSVNLENARKLISESEIDGLFVGRTAWKAEGLIELVEIGATALRIK